VPGVRDLLDRFRPAGAPGPAGAAGVPADRQESAADELAPVFAALAEVEAECERIRREAAQAAAWRRAEAAEQARAVVAQARGRAASIRAAAATRIREDTAAELAQLAARTTAEADELRRRSARQQPQLVSIVVDRVRAELTTLDGQAAPAGPDGAAG
jgi:flagellar biosynthesis/type III secretory pathway protein FliH